MTHTEQGFAPADAVGVPISVEEPPTRAPAKRLMSEAKDVVYLGLDLARGTQWPGGVLGAMGAVILGIALITEQVDNRLTSSEYVATLLIGAALALAGPLVIAYTGIAARRAAVDLDVAAKGASAAESHAEAEAQRRRRAEIELELERRRQG
jgi:hypothetical protein